MIVMEYRKYRYTDARLMELGAVIARHLGQHHSAFVAFDTTLTLDWFAEVRETAKGTSLDVFEQGSVGGSTLSRNESMALCREYFHQVHYFVSSAFAGSRSVMEQFDYESYGEVRAHGVKLLRFMQHYLRQAALHEQALVAVGMRPELLRKAEEATQGLDEAISKKVESQSRRRSETAARVSALNTLYLALRRIEKVAGFVFNKDSAAYMFFKLPRQPRSKEKRTVPEAVAEAVLADGQLVAAEPQQEGPVPAMVPWAALPVSALVPQTMPGAAEVPEQGNGDADAPGLP